MPYDAKDNAGKPGSFPLPVSGAPGMAYTNSSKQHPAAYAGPSRNPLNARPGMAGKK